MDETGPWAVSEPEPPESREAVFSSTPLVSPSSTQTAAWFTVRS